MTTKKCFIFVAILSWFNLIPSDSHALGKARDIVDDVQLNPYIMVLQKEFDAASKPTEADGSEVVISDLIQTGRRYDCRVFYALSSSSPSAPAESRSWYEFSKFGRLFLDNRSFLDTGRIKTFAPNVSMQNELWGQSMDRNYYEAIRVSPKGDLLVQSFSPQGIWARTLMNWLGIDEAINSWLARNKGMALPTSIFGATGFIISFSYCPDPATPNALLSHGTDEQVMEHIRLSFGR